jgi:hypothetical protein
MMDLIRLFTWVFLAVLVLMVCSKVLDIYISSASTSSLFALGIEPDASAASFIFGNTMFGTCVPTKSL